MYWVSGPEIAALEEVPVDWQQGVQAGEQHCSKDWPDLQVQRLEVCWEVETVAAEQRASRAVAEAQRGATEAWIHPET